MLKSDAASPKTFLPVHFFSIVLNGEPFIRHHIEVLNALPSAWHWHIIEGVAALNHDTAWSRRHGGTIGSEFHSGGLSIDGTTAYLDELAAHFPGKISIYRKPPGIFWDGKIEMVRAPQAKIKEECLLWQMDVDELWTVEQIRDVQKMFHEHPAKTAAYFYCHYFVGENLVTTTRNTYGNRASYEWLRVWRYRPDFQWITHEPPRLCQQTAPGKWIDLATINPFSQSETEARTLVFQHFAYVTEEQLRFKETYYGYRGALPHWRRLQAAKTFPVRLREFFPWVTDETLVGRPALQPLRPLAQKNVLGQWRFRHRELSPTEPKSILFVRPDSIGDAILAASMLQPIRDRHPHAKFVVVCQEHVAEIYDACPHVDEVISVLRQKAIDDLEYRNRIACRLQEVRADLCLNSVYSREPLTDFLALSSLAPKRVAHQGGTELMALETKAQHDRLYSNLVPSTSAWASEINRHREFLKGIGLEAATIHARIWLKAEDEDFAEEFFRRQPVPADRTVALFAGAQSECRVYERYGEALAEISGRENLAIIAVGLKYDYEINPRHLESLPTHEPTPAPLPGGELATGASNEAPLLGGAGGGFISRAQSFLEQAASHALNLSGMLTLRQTAAILKRCRIAVGGETGLAHIACAVGTPNVIVIGGGHFGRFMPYSPLTSVVCLPLECYGCNWLCRYPRAHCVKDVVPKVLTEAIRRTLAEISDKPRIFVQGNSLWETSDGLPKWKGFERWLDTSSMEIIRFG